MAPSGLYTRLCHAFLVLDILLWSAQRDLDKISELKQQLRKMAKRDETTRLELSEQKKAAEALAASSVEKLKTAQKEKMELQATLDEVNAVSVAVLMFLAVFKCKSLATSSCSESSL